MRKNLLFKILKILTLILLAFSLSDPSSFNTIKAEQVSLSLVPEIIVAPYIESDIGAFIVIVNLSIKDVQDFQAWKLEFQHDKNILKFLTAKLGEEFYKSTGGWYGRFSEGRFGRKSFSGSAVFFKYYFITTGIGSTTFTLVETELLDKFNNSIPHIVSGCEITIVPFEDWVNEEYKKLLDNYEMLKESYDVILSKYDSLNITSQNLSSEFEKLQEENTDLEIKYSDSLDEIDGLIANNSKLKQEKEEFFEITDSMREEMNSLRKDVNTYKNMSYVTILITVFVVIFVGYMKMKQ